MGVLLNKTCYYSRIYGGNRRKVETGPRAESNPYPGMSGVPDLILLACAACVTKISYLLFCMYFETIEWTLQFVKETPQLKWQ